MKDTDFCFIKDILPKEKKFFFFFTDSPHSKSNGTRGSW